MEVTSCDIEKIYRVFSACKGENPTLILDLRPSKEFCKQHVLHSFCVRVSANGAALLDYSKASYDHQSWVDACWWDRDCILYGPPDLKRDHPVALFLSRNGHARSVRVFKEGFEAVAAAYPFLCTSSVKTNAAKQYPSRLAPYLYLGDWGHAEAQERLAELNVRSVITIHNNPERLKLPAGMRQLRIEMADVDSEDIAPWLLKAHEFIEQAREAGHAVLVHCGAGVSRSAALAIAHLMRRNRWGAQHALEYVQERRSIVKPNDGFWHALCVLEGQLGVADRSNPEAFHGVHGLDYQEAAAAVEAAKVNVTFIPERKEDSTAEKAEAVREAPSKRSRSRSRGRRRRSHSRSRSRSRGRTRHVRSRSPPRRRRSRSLSRDRRQPRVEAPPEPLEQQPRQPAGGGEAGPVLEILKDGHALGRLVVAVTGPSQECIFGRLPSCDVPLEHLSVSRHHAKLTTDGAGAFFITDLGSAHGTNVDGAWIRPKAARQLHEGSVLRFGASTREYRVAKLPAKA